MVQRWQRLLAAAADKIGPEPVAVCLSGGVDSSVLLAAAKRSSDHVVAVTARSPAQRRADLEGAAAVASQLGVQHVVVDSNELEDPVYRENGQTRCYVCKGIILGQVIRVGQEYGCKRVVEGSNADDRGLFRPGMKAVQELGVDSPLAEAGLSKDDVRLIARELGLSNWSRPASGCLATRIEAGQKITRELLVAVGRVEDALYRLGLGREGPLRARVHGELIRIEAASRERFRLVELADKVVVVCRQAGFRLVTVDLEGYKMGSQDVLLPDLK